MSNQSNRRVTTHILVVYGRLPSLVTDETIVEVLVVSTPLSASLSRTMPQLVHGNKVPAPASDKKDKDEETRSRTNQRMFKKHKP